jgi:hypothetical protein
MRLGRGLALRRRARGHRRFPVYPGDRDFAAAVRARSSWQPPPAAASLPTRGRERQIARPQCLPPPCGEGSRVGVGPGKNPSSVATRHLLPQGEKGRRCSPPSHSSFSRLTREPRLVASTAARSLGPRVEHEGAGRSELPIDRLKAGCWSAPSRWTPTLAAAFPPRKGEGALEAQRRLDAAQRLRLPPPCGEGSGVGVERQRTSASSSATRPFSPDGRRKAVPLTLASPSCPSNPDRSTLPPAGPRELPTPRGFGRGACRRRSRRL